MSPSTFDDWIVRHVPITVRMVHHDIDEDGQQTVHDGGAIADLVAIYRAIPSRARQSAMDAHRREARAWVTRKLQPISRDSQAVGSSLGNLLNARSSHDLNVVVSLPLSERQYFCRFFDGEQRIAICATLRPHFGALTREANF